MENGQSALLVDFYQLTMLDAYHAHGMDKAAVFEFFVRKLPEGRNFLVAAGLEQVLDYLEGVCFSDDEIEWLAGTGKFDRGFLDYLAGLEFTGDVHAMPEGTVLFPDEPILRVTAPLPQAQLVESRVINLLHFQTLIASKAVRSRLAAGDRLLVDFGMRRAHGAEAGLLAARAAYIAGFNSTATVLAGKLYDIPVTGTMAHSFIQAHDDELVAFEQFADAQPDNLILLIDTYDIEKAARKVIELSHRLYERGLKVKGVRIDSGDLAAGARRVRAILDEAGLNEVFIFVSGSLDENRIADIVGRNAPVDGYGIGTLMDTSADVPYLDSAYKLQEYAGVPKRKRSEGKATWPGRKQVYRFSDAEGGFTHDILTTEDDEHGEGEPLIVPVMRNGRRIRKPEPLPDIQARLRTQLERLPGRLTGLEQAGPYKVEISSALRVLAEEADAKSGG